MTCVSIALHNRWFRLVIGIALLAGVLVLLANAPTPPGMAGEIIEHNIRQDVQTTALFYMDLECMPEIEDRLEEDFEISSRDRQGGPAGR